MKNIYTPTNPLEHSTETQIEMQTEKIPSRESMIKAYIAHKNQTKENNPQENAQQPHLPEDFDSSCMENN